METAIPIATLVIAIGLAAVAAWYWIRILVEISRSGMVPAEKRKWWWRVFLLRFVGVIWYLEHQRRQTRCCA
jgi:hypothetical protein